MSEIFEALTLVCLILGLGILFGIGYNLRRIADELTEGQAK